jgi:hypothetical protein
MAVALMMETAGTSKTPVSFYQTARRDNQKTSVFILAAVRT